MEPRATEPRRTRIRSQNWCRAADKPGAAYFGFSAAVPCRRAVQKSKPEADRLRTRKATRSIDRPWGRVRLKTACPGCLGGIRSGWAGKILGGCGLSVRRTVMGNGPSQAPGYSFGSFIQKFEVSGESRGTNPGLEQTCPHARSRCPDEERPGQEEPDRTKTESVSTACDPKRRRKEGPDRLTCPGGRSG